MPESVFPLRMGEVISVVAGVSFLRLAMTQATEARRFRRDAVRVRGRIVGWEVEYSEQGAESHAARVQFTPRVGGKPVVFTSTLRVGDPRRYRGPRAVTVLHVPGDPDSPEVAGRNPRIGAVIVSALLGAAGLALAAVLIYADLHRRR